MYTKTVTVTNAAGLHARPATMFIQQAGAFKSNITVEYGRNHTNAKSLLGVLALGVDQGAEITLSASGPDEKPAVDTLAAMIAADFAE